MLKRYFIKQGMKEAAIENFIKKAFPYSDYSRTEIQRTPLGIKIIIYTNKPGRIIGRGGRTINEMTEAIKKEFNLENPQIDVKTVRRPNLDAKIVAKQIASALERGFKYKKMGNLALKRIMDAGAIGAEIIIAGKLGGSKSMTAKFLAGYIKHSGKPSVELVDEGYEEALVKLGKIGIKVRIMSMFVDITGEVKRVAGEAPVEIEKKELPEKAILEEIVELKEKGQEAEEEDIIPEATEEKLKEKKEKPVKKLKKTKEK